MQPRSGAIKDGDELSMSASGQEWRVSWHPAGEEPPGTCHGSAGICFVSEQQIALVSRDGEHWGLAGGRPENNETWEETLKREVLEEACATVTEARLLGFSRSRCVSGPQKGLVLVRAFWRAEVELAEWLPQFEMPFRRVFPESEVREILLQSHPGGDAPTVLRVFDEAMMYSD